MSQLEDVDRAVKILAHSEKYVLQCTSAYPCPDDKLNLRVIPIYKERFGEMIDGVGFSGHHGGIAPDIAAYMMGARNSGTALYFRSNDEGQRPCRVFGKERCRIHFEIHRPD